MRLQLVARSDKTRRAISLALFFLFLLQFPLLSSKAAGPPDLKEFKSYLVLQSDGTATVKQDLTFLETDSRDVINKFGPFDSGHRIKDQYLLEGSQKTSASLVSLGSNFYKAEFSSETVPGKTYTFHWEYTIDRDITGNSRQGTRDFGWAPIQWSVPIEKIIVQVVLPVELSSNINKPEQVTDAIVNATGLQTNESNKSNFDRFIFFPTPDERTGKNYLSVHAEKDNAVAEEKAYLELFFPEKYFTSQTNPPEKEEKNFFINIVAGIDDDTRTINIMNVDPRWLGSGKLQLVRKIGNKTRVFQNELIKTSNSNTYFLLDNDSLEPGEMAYYQAKIIGKNNSVIMATPEATYNAENVTSQIIESAKVKIDIDQKGTATYEIQSDMLFRGDKGDWSNEISITLDKYQWMEAPFVKENETDFILSKSGTPGTYILRTYHDIFDWQKLTYYWGAKNGEKKTFRYGFKIYGAAIDGTYTDTNEDFQYFDLGLLFGNSNAAIKKLYIELTYPEGLGPAEVYYPGNANSDSFKAEGNKVYSEISSIKPEGLENLYVSFPTGTFKRGFLFARFWHDRSGTIIFFAFLVLGILFLF